MRIENAVAIVTGGTGALGRAVALNLLGRGARVAVSYLTDSEWRLLAEQARSAGFGDRLEGIQADLTEASSVQGLVKSVEARWGRIDFGAAVAGGFAAGKSYQTDERTWDQQFNLNLRSLYLLLRAVVPVMIRQNFGRIVAVSSGAILHGGGAGIAAYAISKNAVRQLTEILAEELKEHDIHVHSVLPGTMDTEANRRAMPQADFSQWVTTEAVAEVIVWLMSEESDAVRSAAVPVLG